MIYISHNILENEKDKLEEEGLKQYYYDHLMVQCQKYLEFKVELSGEWNQKQAEKFK